MPDLEAVEACLAQHFEVCFDADSFPVVCDSSHSPRLLQLGGESVDTATRPPTIRRLVRCTQLLLAASVQVGAETDSGRRRGMQRDFLRSCACAVRAAPGVHRHHHGGARLRSARIPSPRGFHHLRLRLLSQLPEGDQAALKALVEAVLSEGGAEEEEEGEAAGAAEETPGSPVRRAPATAPRKTPGRRPAPLSPGEAARLAGLGSPAARLAMQCADEQRPLLSALAGRAALEGQRAGGASSGKRGGGGDGGRSRRQLEWDCAGLREEVVRAGGGRSPQARASRTPPAFHLAGRPTGGARPCSERICSPYRPGFWGRRWNGRRCGGGGSPGLGSPPRRRARAPGEGCGRDAGEPGVFLLTLRLDCHPPPVLSPLPPLQRSAELAEALAESQAAHKAAAARAAAATAEASALAGFRCGRGSCRRKS